MRAARPWVLILVLPVLTGFDGAHARQALDHAFHNLYGSDVLMGVHLEIESPGDATGVDFAYGRRVREDETRTLVYLRDGKRDAPRALLLQRPEGEDSIYVTEGAHGAVRPLSTGRRSLPLFGSDFAYEDFRSRSVDDYRIEVLGSDRIDGEPCHVLRLRPFDGPYRVVIVWLSQERPVIVRTDYFDAEGLWKRYHANVESVEQHYGWWVPMHDEMFDLRTGSRTTRQIQNLLVDVEIPEALFTTTRLSRGRLPRF